MGRSKFPGKPSKHVNKKRVNVLPCSIVKSNDTSAVENIHSKEFGVNCYNSEQFQATAISVLEDVKSIATGQHAETEKKDTNIDGESRSKCSSFVTNSIFNSTAIKEKQNDNIKLKDNETESVNLGNIRRANKTNAFLYNYTNFTVKNTDGVTKSKVKSLKVSKQLIRKSTELNKLTKATIENYDSSSAKGTPSSLNRKSMYTKHRAVKNRKKNSPIPSTSSVTRLHEKETTSLVGKFVLPSRSLHSSRVIKPNKRFITHEQISNTNSVECVSKTSSKRTKVIPKNIVSYGKNKKSACESASEKSQQDTVLSKKATNTKDTCSNIKCCSAHEVESGAYLECTMSESSRDSSDMVVIDSADNSSNASWTCGKLILRKARLQLHTQSSEGTDGPFSSYSTATTNPPGTVTCGVCGAVRFYRFVKQARKFNIYSCESCRKFISKMIKRQTCAKNCAIPTLVCHKGQGMCHVPPIVRSQQWKLIRCAYKARCPACWLKMCLRSFQMPAQLKLSLTNMLPENMRSFVDYNMSTNNEIPQKKLLSSAAHLPTWQTDSFTTDIKRASVKEKSNKLLDGFISPLKLDSKLHTLSNDRKEKKHRKSRLRVRKKGIMIANQTSINVTSDCTKRQKIDLKGPRVKHVCRSASIVLGQPLATFSHEITVETEKKESTCNTNKPNSCVTCNYLSDEQSLDLPEKENATSKEQVTHTTNDGISETTNDFAIPPQNSSEEISTQEGDETMEQNKDLVPPLILISADYMDKAEINDACDDNFELISSESFSVRSMCLYCGSAGQEGLIYCVCCCEPFHLYCTSDSWMHINLQGGLARLQKPWNFAWTCSRCTVCHRCGNVDKQKIACKKCYYYYHPECFQLDLKDYGQPLVCSTCLQCENCSSESTSLVCNFSLCTSCFKLKNKENPCSICLKHTDTDVSNKMLQCVECRCLVHAKCDEVIEEEWNILSFLPSSIFKCRTCSFGNPSYWKQAIKILLKNGYHKILRSLSKNATVKDLIRKGISTSRTCSCKLGSRKPATSENFQTLFKESAKNENNDADISLYGKKCTVEKNTENLQLNIRDEIVLDDKDNDNFKNSCEYFDQRNDDNFDINLKNIRKKFCIKECSVRIKNFAESKEKNICNRILRDQSNEYDKRPCSVIKNEKYPDTLEKSDDIRQNKFCCKCDLDFSISLLNVKKKINCNVYNSTKEFQNDVEQIIKKMLGDEILEVFESILKEVFPWYNCGYFYSNYAKNNNLALNCKFKNDWEYCSSKNNELCNAKFKENVPEYAANLNIVDVRQCLLCKRIGDGSLSLEGRLLYCGFNDWIHVNCAFWSSDVNEDVDGSLQNVHDVINQSHMTRCSVCRETGASVACCVKSCNKIYHYTCARDMSCAFSNNKSVYCPVHATLTKTIVIYNEFEFNRPVFIAFDRKKKKYAEPSKIQYLVGSLTVTNLGIFFPTLSDIEEAIIPSEFVCSRLYWSTIEPWKIVKYEITTSVLMPHLKDVHATERNFTVDHSLSIDEIDKAMTTIYRWKKDFEYFKMDDINITNVVSILDEEKECINYTDDEKVVSQVLEYMLDQICNKEAEENCEDEPQNTADLLPPELKDAIFEDLPHDLLDGISMQDIFPKFMSYEDVITMDLKTSDLTDGAEFLKDPKTDLGSDVVADLDNYEFSQFTGRKSDIVNDDLWAEPKYSIQNLDDIQNGKKISSVNGQQLKRSKSEVFPGIKKLTRTRNHQRSCSLTWSCKLDNTLTTNIKKRKMSCSKSVADISNNLFMVVDGTGDKGNMLQELRLPDGVLMAVGRSTNADCVTDAVREYKYCLGENTTISNDKLKSQPPDIEHGKENKCRIWQGRSQPRILQVDGADDMSSSGSESESCPYNCENTSNVKVKKCSHSKTKSDEPVKCDRCQCTYRTHTSYKRHLATCDFITTSESDSDTPAENDKVAICTPLFSSSNTNNDTLFVNNSVGNSELKVMENSHLMSTENYSPVQQAVATFSTVPSETITTNCVFVKNSPKEVVCSSTQIASHKVQNDASDRIDLIKNSPTINILPVLINSENVHQHKMEHMQSFPNNKNEMINQQRSIKMNEFAANDRAAVAFNTQSNNVTQVVSSENNIIRQKMLVAKVPPVPKQTATKQKTSTARASRARTCRLVPNRRLRTEKSVNLLGHPTTLQTGNSVHIPDIQNNSGPTVIIQHLSSPNLVPAYVEAFQQQTGQNLQCIATIVPNEYKPAPYITPNPIVPGAYHVQSADSTNLISLPNNGLSVLSGLQVAQQQPTVMGTLIQQPRPTATIQCGVMATEQLVLGTVPTVDTIVTDSSGSMYFTSQPVYYGFETIVQNTVMSSQQFVSTTLPGILASNSSYAATTTQVFQTSKIEPVMDMNGTGYILVNPTVPQVTTPITVNPVMAQLENRCTSIAPQQAISDVQPTYSVHLGPVSESQAHAAEPVLMHEQSNIEERVPCMKTSIPSAQLFEATSMEISNMHVNSMPAINSITLPVAPSVTETGIPMNIVNPIPQVSANTTQVSRPMNRVLPMQSAPPQKDFQKVRSPINKVISLEPPGILNKLSDTVDKIQETLNNDVECVQASKLNANDSQLLKLESASLKLVFQKQSQDGIYKISNKYISKNNKPIQITPMKQTKPKTVDTIINMQNNVPFEKKNNYQEKETLKNNSNIMTQKSPNIMYSVHSEDGFTYSSTSMTDLWRKVFETVQSARAAHNMPPLPESSFDVIRGLNLLGLESNGLRYLVEQLPGTGKCTKYRPTFHKPKPTPETDDSLELNQSLSAARCEPHLFKKEPYDMFSWLASRHRKPDYIVQMEPENASRRTSNVNLPMAMRFRQLKETSKHAVGVYRSNIHGRGLFCLRDIECGEMVIEYAGEVIRSTLTDKREKYYNSKGIGCYMFRVDDNLVIDATMKGNAARFINHSCDPNCYSRVLDILGHKHILIFALRKIMQGEELTYDYKFPFEEDKIPCTCGSKRCRKYLN